MLAGMMEEFRGVGLSPWEAVLAAGLLGLFVLVMRLNYVALKRSETAHAERKKENEKQRAEIEDLRREVYAFYACPHFSCPMRRLKPPD